MKKNWLLFFAICGLTYVWLFYTQYQNQQAQEAAMAQYELELAAWQKAQEEQELLREEGLKQLEDMTRQVEAGTAEGEAGTSGVPRLETAQRELQEKLLTVAEAPTVEVETDLYRVVFTELGARPIDWEIKSSEYVRNVSEVGEDGEVSVFLVPQISGSADREFPFQLVGDTARDFNKKLFTSQREELDGATRLRFTSDPIHGLVAKKEFTFHHDSYVVDLVLTFENGPETGKSLGFRQGFGTGWQGGFGPPHASDRVHGYGENTIISVDGDLKTRKLDRKDAPDIFRNDAIEWAGQEKKFFVSLIIPDPVNPVTEVRTRFETRNDADEYRQLKRGNIPLSLDLLHDPIKIEPNETIKLKYQVYAGPKNRETLASKMFQLGEGVQSPSALVFHNVPLGMDFLRPLCLGLLWLMKKLHDLIGVWGFAIIATTIIVRILIYPLTHWAIKNQARTMIEQQKIRPEMEAITKKYKNDPMKRNQATMQLYRDHNVSPFGMLRGCVPMLLQMPVFLALYVLFEQSVELRGQSFLWIDDLAQPDKLVTWNTSIILIGTSFNLLPLLMGATNFFQMRIMRMPATDPTQEKIQKQMATMMPIMFVFFLYSLPAGLILYWIVSNCISILQSLLTKRIIASHMKAHEAEKAAAQASAQGGEQKIREKALT